MISVASLLSSVISNREVYLRKKKKNVGAYPDEHQHGGRKLTETSVAEFCYKIVNLFFDELINIEVTLCMRVCLCFNE